MAQKLYYNPAYREPVGAEMLLDHVMYRAQGKHSATVRVFKTASIAPIH